MTLQIVVIMGHPLSGSLDHSLAESYILRAGDGGPRSRSSTWR
jgi:hypothetical protein